MNIVLRPELRKFVKNKISSGEYSSASDMINGALLAMQGREKLSDSELRELREDVRVGVAQADREQFVKFTAADVITQGRRMLKRKKRAG